MHDSYSLPGVMHDTVTVSLVSCMIQLQSPWCYAWYSYSLPGVMHASYSLPGVMHASYSLPGVMQDTVTASLLTLTHQRPLLPTYSKNKQHK